MLQDRSTPPPVAADAPHAVIVGAGFGGLAAALRLSVRGYRVTVVERLPQAGGRARVFRQDGFTFDAGPTVITAPFLLEELWRLCGYEMREEIDLREVSPFYRIRFHDGSLFDYTGSLEAMHEQVRRLSPRDVPHYERFVAMSRRIFAVGFEQLAHVPFGTPWSMLRVLPAMLRLQSFRSAYGLVASFVRHPKLRQVLSFHTLLVGGNPFTTSSIYTLIAHLERKWGVHFPMGGTGVLVDGLVRLIEARGGEVRLGAEVEEIEVQQGKACGVRLAGGERLPAAIVVSNADAVWTHSRLLPADLRQRPAAARLTRLRSSMGLFVWYFGTRRQYTEVAHHTILLGPRYRELLDEIFHHKTLADDFSLYLHRPTATDPSLAPPGCDAFYVLSPVPHQDSGIDWRAQAEPYRQAICRYLSDSVLPGLEAEIVSSRLLTPLDFEHDYLAYRGSAFGVEPVLWQSAYLRPHNRSKLVDGLFLVGAGTHPGAGVPGVLSSARVLDGLVPDAPQLALQQIPEPAWQACRTSLQCGSKSFAAAAKLLPRRFRRHAAALYACLRELDDDIDERHQPTAMLDARIDGLYQGVAEDAAPVWRCGAAVVRAYALPRSVFDALLEGFAWDRSGRRYDTVEELCRYASRVAGTVGVLMSRLMGCTSPEMLARACDLGIAMQLTNIARDVGEDARRGRLYLPQQWLREAGVDAERWLAQPQWQPAIGQVVQRLLHEAELLYARADVGIAALPLRFRLAIGAARHVYAGIHGALQRVGFNSVDRRVYTSKGTKVLAMLRAGRFLWRRADTELLLAPPHQAAQFLL